MSPGHALSINQPSPLLERQVTFPTPENASHLSAYSPNGTVTSELLTADLASIRWLDLLANDALEANRGFSRTSSPVNESQLQAFGLGAPLELPNLGVRFGEHDPTNARGISEPWQLGTDIGLKDFETLILRNFVDRAALWVS